MKIASTIARFLLAFVFIVFGLNGFLHFIPQPPPPSEMAGQYFTVMVASHYLVFVFGLQLIAGVLFLFRRTVPLALTIAGPLIVNILLFHALMDPRRDCAWSRGNGSLVRGLLAIPRGFLRHFLHRSTIRSLWIICTVGPEPTRNPSNPSTPTRSVSEAAARTARNARTDHMPHPPRSNRQLITCRETVVRTGNLQLRTSVRFPWHH